MLVGTHAEVLEGLTGVLGSAEEEGVATGGGAEGELVEGDGLAAGSGDASAGGGGEAQGSDGQLGDGQETVVVSDGSDDDDGALVLLVQVADNAGDGDGRAVDARHEETAQDDLVEVGVGATCSGLVDFLSFVAGFLDRGKTYGSRSGTASREA